MVDTGPRATGWLVAATVLGAAHAAVSVTWALGGTWLLDTVGGQLEVWGRDGGLPVRAALLGVAAVKLAVVGLVWIAVRRGGAPARALAWAAAAVLVLYGGALTLVQGVVLSGVADVAVEDTSALRWHTFLWDPWFLAWGACAAVALAATRRVRR